MTNDVLTTTAASNLRKGEVNTVQALLEAGADVHARDSAGGTALHAAAIGGHVDACRVLLEAGSDCNAVDQGTNSPLHMLASPTARGRGTELATLLLEWGASVDIKNSEGLTAVSAALGTKNRALVLAYRSFFGDDSGLNLARLSRGDSFSNRTQSIGSSLCDEKGNSDEKTSSLDNASGEAVQLTTNDGRVLKSKRAREHTMNSTIDAAEVLALRENTSVDGAGGIKQAEAKTQRSTERQRTEHSPPEGKTVATQEQHPTKMNQSAAAIATSEEKTAPAVAANVGAPSETIPPEQDATNDGV